METERLLITELRKEDKEDYFLNISNDKKVLETFICTYSDSLENFDFTKYLNRKDIFAIRLKESKKLIGIITMFNNNGEECEIGYAVGSNYWNQGYTTEAVKEFINHLFKTTNYKTVMASFFKENLVSKRVMEKVGMTFSHVNLNELEYLGISRDLIYYKIDK